MSVAVLNIVINILRTTKLAFMFFLQILIQELYLAYVGKLEVFTERENSEKIIGRNTKPLWLLDSFD